MQGLLNLWYSPTLNDFEVSFSSSGMLASLSDSLSLSEFRTASFFGSVFDNASVAAIHSRTLLLISRTLSCSQKNIIHIILFIISTFFKDKLSHSLSFIVSEKRYFQTSRRPLIFAIALQFKPIHAYISISDAFVLPIDYRSIVSHTHYGCPPFTQACHTRLNT